MLNKSNDLIINFTPTGMVPTKDMTPHIPVSSSEIIEQVHQAFELGITMVHLHARDEITGEPVSSAADYEKITTGIKKHCPSLIIGLSLSGRTVSEFEKRSECIELYPDMGSLTLSSLNFAKQASVNSPETITRLAKKMLAFGVKPELEVFDLGMINYSNYLIKKGLLKPPYYYNVLFGNIAGLQVDFSHMGAALNDLPEDSYWAFAGLGDNQLKANTCAIAFGGGVRIGLEDNLYFDTNKDKKATNLELLKRIHHLATIFERKVMAPETLGNQGFYNPNR